jgi:hypothetical protein
MTEPSPSLAARLRELADLIAREGPINPVMEWIVRDMRAAAEALEAKDKAMQAVADRLGLEAGDCAQQAPLFPDLMATFLNECAGTLLAALRDRR